MGTRGFIGFIVDGTEKIFARHKDSYPGGAGLEVLSWLTRNRDALTHPGSDAVWDRVRALRTVRWPEPTLADAERIRSVLLEDAAEPNDRAHVEQADAREVLSVASEDVLIRAGLIPGLAPADLERVRDVLHRHDEDRWDPAYIHGASIHGASAEELLEFVTYELDALLEAGVMWDGSYVPIDSLYCEWGYLIDLDSATFEVYRGFQKAPHTAGRYAHRAPVRDGCHPVALVASWPLTNLPDRDCFMAPPGAY